jgi:hypothetical protein
MSGFTLNDAAFLDGVFIPGPGATGGVSPPTHSAIHFAGASALQRDTPLTGASDSYNALISVWLLPTFPNLMEGDDNRIVSTNNLLIALTDNLDDTYTLSITIRVPMGMFITWQLAPVAYPADWTHYLFSLDTNHATNAKVCQVYVNDVDKTVSSSTDDTAGAYLIPWATDDSTAFFGIFDTGDYFKTYVGDEDQLWYATNQTLDLATTGNRRKFINADITHVDLGATGGTPTGTDPLVYFYGAATELPNLGSGEVFDTHGPLTNAATGIP